MRHVFTAAMLAASIAAFGFSQIAYAADDAKPDTAHKDGGSKGDKPDLPPSPRTRRSNRPPPSAQDPELHRHGRLAARARRGRQEDRRNRLHRLHAGRPARLAPPGDVRLQRRPGRGLGLSQSRRHRAQAHPVRRRGRQRLRSRRVARQPRHLARLHRSGLHRPGGHRLLALAPEAGGDGQEVLPDQAGHRIPVPHRLRLAPEERSDGVAQICGGRELRRLSRPGHRPRTADRAGRRRLRRGDGVPGAGWAQRRRPRHLADGLDDHPCRP